MSEVPQKKGWSTGAKWGMGCGMGCLTIIVALVAVSVVGYRFAKDKLEDVTREMKQLGFEHVITLQSMEVRDPITVPTLYRGQMVKIFGDCHTNLAVVAQMAEIHGRVSGKLYFRGQMLTLQPNAEVLGGVDVAAQVVQNYGTIHGGITGKCQLIKSPAKEDRAR